MDDEKATATEQELFELSEKDIYKFTKEFPADAGQGIPNHYHICVKTAKGYSIFNCCTSQSGKVKDRIQFFGRTYVEVTNMKKTQFTMPTFVDCDNVFTITDEDFAQYVNDGKVEFSGIISGSDYQHIVNGILASEMVEESTKKLFK